MKTFLLIKEQDILSTEPCDYCPNDANVTVIKAESLEEAKEKCLQLDKNWKNKCKTVEDCEDLLEDSELVYANPEYEFYCKNINLYEVVQKVNLQSFYKNRIKEIEQLKEQLEEEL